MELPRHKLKCMSLWNPWAWALFRAGKDLENRPWNSKFRGWLAIQVSKHWEMSEVTETLLAIKKAVERSGRAQPEIDLQEIHAQRGYVIGMVLIDEWKPAHLYDSPWAFSDGYAAHVARAVELPRKVLCRGTQGLFDLPMDQERAVRWEFRDACRELGLRQQDENSGHWSDD